MHIINTTSAGFTKKIAMDFCLCRAILHLLHQIRHSGHNTVEYNVCTRNRTTSNHITLSTRQNVNISLIGGCKEYEYVLLPSGQYISPEDNFTE